jgi:5-oxoprolinase (ATP-hydrolysing) subunit B
MILVAGEATRRPFIGYDTPTRCSSRPVQFLRGSNPSAQPAAWQGEPVDTMHYAPLILPCGDTALTVEFAQAVDAGVNARVRALDAELARATPAGVIETMPTYGSLLVCYDPVIVDFATLAAQIRTRLDHGVLAAPVTTGWRIPVTYGGALGFDLEAAAKLLALPAPEVVRRHAASTYQVYMIGFLPGFTYLGGLDPTLAIPRRPVPRHSVPAGSIVIGGIQTAIGSIAGPSGWHVIGRTPVKPFMASREPAIFMMPGDRIALHAVDVATFDDLAAAAERGMLVAEPLS